MQRCYILKYNEIFDVKWHFKKMCENSYKDNTLYLHKGWKQYDIAACDILKS